MQVFHTSHNKHSDSYGVDAEGRKNTLKIEVHNIKRVCINILVDAASVLEITAGSSAASMAFMTLYASYYKTNGLPTPEAFSSASFQFATAISFIFAVLFTRKYRIKEPKQTDSNNKECT
jgi:hypothetical protein